MNFRNKILFRTVQVVLGLYLLFAVLSSYVQFFPAPQFNEAAMAFFGALFATGYILPLMQLIFLISGLMFIFNKWSALGAIMLFPITVNILLFHIFLEPMGISMAIIFAIMHFYLIAVHWPRYLPMVSKRFK